jgi:predicted esterase
LKTNPGSNRGFLFAMTEQSVQFMYKARYFTLGDVTRAEKVWLVLHGYGQLAPYFLKKFSSLEKRGIAVIAPEGLSRFYLEDVASRAQSGNNRVGATWMTREGRTVDIKNYLAYLDSICEAEFKSSHSRQLTVLGFSQGAATASRWALHSSFQIDRLILWAGILPPDMDFATAADRFKKQKIVVVSGKQDPFLTDAKTMEMTAISHRLGINPDIIQFNGGHELDAETLQTLV